MYFNVYVKIFKIEVAELQSAKMKTVTVYRYIKISSRKYNTLLLFIKDFKENKIFLTVCMFQLELSI